MSGYEIGGCRHKGGKGLSKLFFLTPSGEIEPMDVNELIFKFREESKDTCIPAREITAMKIPDEPGSFVLFCSDGIFLGHFQDPAMLLYKCKIREIGLWDSETINAIANPDPAQEPSSKSFKRGYKASIVDCFESIPYEWLVDKLGQYKVATELMMEIRWLKDFLLEEYPELAERYSKLPAEMRVREKEEQDDSDDDKPIDFIKKHPLCDSDDDKPIGNGKRPKSSHKIREPEPELSNEQIHARIKDCDEAMAKASKELAKANKDVAKAMKDAANNSKEISKLVAMLEPSK